MYTLMQIVTAPHCYCLFFGKTRGIHVNYTLFSTKYDSKAYQLFPPNKQSYHPYGDSTVRPHWNRLLKGFVEMNLFQYDVEGNLLQTSYYTWIHLKTLFVTHWCSVCLLKILINSSYDSLASGKRRVHILFFILFIKSTLNLITKRFIIDELQKEKSMETVS